MLHKITQKMVREVTQSLHEPNYYDNSCSQCDLRRLTAGATIFLRRVTAGATIILRRVTAGADVSSKELWNWRRLMHLKGACNFLSYLHFEFRLLLLF